jgi:exonuclease III
MGSESVLIWNICCLNARLHMNTLREMITVDRPSIVCIQETKMYVILDYDVLQFLGPGFDYLFLPEQTRGGIMSAWLDMGWAMSAPSTCRFLVSTKIRNISGGEEWWLTSTYCPTQNSDKHEFLTKLCELV